MTSPASLLNDPRPEPKRDRYGRYLIGGKPYTRATTWAKTVADQFNLGQWEKRQVARGLTLRADLVAAIAATSDDDKDRLNQLCDQAKEAAASSAAANLGTALHAFTERVDRGEEVHIPAPWDADVAAYRAKLAELSLVPSLIERIVVCSALGVAGTFDRLLATPEGDCIGDLKTGRDLYWSEVAIQLALYANADALYDPATDTLEPMPKVDRDRGLVIHLPVGKATCEVWDVDINAGWEMAQVCGTVRDWRKRKDLATPYNPTRLDVVVDDAIDYEDHAYLVDMHRDRVRIIIDAGHGPVLARAWPAGVPTMKAGNSHTPAELDIIDRLLADVEREFRLPFPDRPMPPVEIRLDSAVAPVLTDRNVLFVRAWNALQSLPAELRPEVVAEVCGSADADPTDEQLALITQHATGLARVVTTLKPTIEGTNNRDQR